MNGCRNISGWGPCVLSLIFALMALAACLSPAEQLQGSYTMTIAEEEIPTGFGTTNLTPDDIALLSGDWQLNFLADGIFTVTKNGETMIEEGHYTVNNDMLTVGQETGPASCVGPPSRVEEPGLYKWVSQGDQMLFLPVDEKCGGRMVVFSAAPWARVK